MTNLELKAALSKVVALPSKGSMPTDKQVLAMKALEYIEELESDNETILESLRSAAKQHVTAVKEAMKQTAVVGHDLSVCKSLLGDKLIEAAKLRQRLYELKAAQEEEGLSDESN